MSTLAERQLAAWEKLAANWAYYEDDDERVARCHCGQGIVLLTDNQGRPYWYTDEQWLALFVLHLRNHHPDLDPDR